jgi:hypothetical protein
MYVVSGHEKGHFGTQAGHVTRLVESRPRGMKVLYKTRSSPIR